VLHPLIGQALSGHARQLEQLGEALLCYEAPLLIESGRAETFRPLVLVVANESLQSQRVMHRDGMSASDVHARIAAQWPTSEKSTKADYLILNEGTLQDFLAEADVTLAKVCRQLKVDGLRFGLS